jgi:ABC-type glycerol-3-phosphate transport system permease component
MTPSLAQRWVRLVALGVGMIFVAFPFYWMMLTAFSPRDALFRPPFQLVRFDFSLGNFEELLFATEFLIYL